MENIMISRFLQFSVVSTRFLCYTHTHNFLATSVNITTSNHSLFVSVATFCQLGNIILFYKFASDFLHRIIFDAVDDYDDCNGEDDDVDKLNCINEHMLHANSSKWNRVILYAFEPFQLSSNWFTNLNGFKSNYLLRNSTIRNVCCWTWKIVGGE